MDTPAPKTDTPAPEISLGVGVDKQQKKVMLELKVAGESPLHCRIFFDEAETARLASTLVKAALELRGDKATGLGLVLPKGMKVEELAAKIQEAKVLKLPGR